MGGQCMTNQFSVDSKASFFAIFGGQFLDLQNAMKFGDVSKVLPRNSLTWFSHGSGAILAPEPLGRVSFSTTRVFETLFSLI